MTRPVALALLALAAARPAAGLEVFKNDWCVCLIPEIHPENPVSVSNLAYGVALAPDGRLRIAGTATRPAPDLGSGWTVEAAAPDGGPVAWTRSYVWQRSYFDVARSVAVDASGRTVVAGYSEFSAHGPIPAAWLVAVYDQAGAPVWADTQVRQGVVRAEAVAVGPRGDIYVAGWDERPTGVGSRWLMGKYTPEGRIAWSRTFGGVSAGRHQAHGIAVDAQGNVIVAGSLDAGAARFAWALAKYSPEGALLWSRSTLNPQSWRDEPYAVTVARDGKIAVVGKESGGPIERVNWSVHLYDARGTLLWTRSNDGAKHMDDKAYAAMFDDCGRLVVAGYEDGDTAQKPPWDVGTGHAVVRAYDETGKVLATLGPEELRIAGGAYGIARGADGAPVVVGYERTAKVGEVRWVVHRIEALACAAHK